MHGERCKQPDGLVESCNSLRNILQKSGLRADTPAHEIANRGVVKRDNNIPHTRRAIANLATYGVDEVTVEFAQTVPDSRLQAEIV
jgi:hypothetical protein